MSPLFKPMTLGSVSIKNRIIMSPLTRARASGADGRTPNDLMNTYYSQRSGAGLIITEATIVSRMAAGYENTAGIYAPAHIEGWRKIIASVHKQDCKMFLQLWHVGRISHPDLLDGELPVAPSAIAAKGHVSLLRPQRDYVVPRALEIHELPGIVESYRQGAANALLAGFDGVEIHGANGYLLDQFLQDGSNKRTDRYGGSIENRARLMMEVTDAVISVWGADRVAMHLAPRCDAHSMGDSNPEATFSYVAAELGKRNLAFICAREAVAPDSLGPKLKRIFKGKYIGNEKFTLASAEEAFAREDIDAVAFGKDFLANPDLVQRLQSKAKLNAPVPETFYAKGAAGYTDYPSLKE